MKATRRLRKQKTRKRKQKGGGYCGPAPKLEGTIHRFTKYWYNTLGRDAFWSHGQDGYYYTNREGCKECYQSTVHTHIHTIEDLDDSRDGMKKISWSTKKSDGGSRTVKADEGLDDMLYTEIAGWLKKKNASVGAEFPCGRT